MFRNLFSGVAIVTAAALAGCDADMEPGSLACADCTIELREVRALGADAEALSPMLRSWVARDSRGRYHVAPVYTPGTVAVFDATGRLVRTVGGEGEGPGEFADIAKVFAIPGDTVVAIDPRRSRLTFIDPEGEFVRTAEVANRVDDFESSSAGDFVVSVRGSDPESGPVQILARDGTLRSAFGRDPDEPVEPMADTRRIALDDEDRVWSARPNEYRVDLFSAAGEPVRSVTREVDWFPRATADAVREAAMRGEVPRLTLLADVALDPDAGLWTLIDRADPEWSPPADQDPSRRLSLEQVDARLIHVIELLDPADGSVLLSSDVEPGGVLRGFLDSSHVFGVREGPGGVTELVVWSIHVVRP